MIQLETTPKDTNGNWSNKSLELATFYIGDALCGINILQILEINKHLDLTPAPQAPDYVKGLLNLRGQIVTVIELAQKIGFCSAELTDKTRNIIVNSKGEHIGFLVEKIGDVIGVDWAKVEMPPANISGFQGKFFKGVVEAKEKLIGIIDIEAVLEED
jgi:purine-binding chemotaxis protein CheW